MPLSGAEREKRHQFYQQHKSEIVSTYLRLRSAKATADELGKCWKTRVPVTTVHGLLWKWNVKKPARRDLRQPLKASGEILPLEAIVGKVVGLEKVESGYRLTFLVETDQPWSSMSQCLCDGVLQIRLSN